MRRSLKLFAILTTIGMIFVLIGGALVTKTSSGLGCGRYWPLCEGVFFPSHLTQALIIELSHRLLSGIVGVMVFILSIWSWKEIGHIRGAKSLAIISFTFLLIQSLIGGAAVLWGQSSFILALHFGISLVSFASVLLLTMIIIEAERNFDPHKLTIQPKMKIHIYGVTIYCYVVVYTGALVRHMHASLACPSWPLCTNSRIMPKYFYEWIQMGHRLAAALIFIWILLAAIEAMSHYKNQRIIFYGWLIALSLVTLQVILGAFIIITHLNLYIALLHSFVISCLFGVLSYLALLVFRSK